MTEPEVGTPPTPAGPSNASKWHLRRRGLDQPRRRAASIYGTIITGSVLAAGGDVLSSLAMEVTVLVTLVVYWIAERYADLLAEHTHAGQLPTWVQIRSSFADSWPMVTSSFLPLVVLLLARLVGISTFGAAEMALFVAVVLLVIHGYRAGKAAGLRGAALFVISAVAALLGIAMVALKALIQGHHQIF